MKAANHFRSCMDDRSQRDRGPEPLRDFYNELMSTDHNDFTDFGR